MKAPCNLSPQIKRDFQPETVRLLKTIGKEGATLDTSIYLVGGAVRDLFRGSAVRDLDLVSETNGVKLAGSLATGVGMKRNSAPRSPAHRRRAYSNRR